MDRKILMDTLGWGIALWLFGFILGIILFPLVSVSLIGWIIAPIGTLLTIFILLKKIKNTSMQQYLLIAISWTAIAIVLDYLFIVKLFKPADGYYKLDVYLYYALTFLLPLLVGWRKTSLKVR